MSYEGIDHESMMISDINAEHPDHEHRTDEQLQKYCRKCDLCLECGEELRKDCSAKGKTYYTCKNCVKTFKPREI